MKAADIRPGDRLIHDGAEVIAAYVGRWNTRTYGEYVVAFPGGNALLSGTPDPTGRTKVAVVRPEHLDNHRSLLPVFADLVSAATLRRPDSLPSWTKHGNTSDYLLVHDGHTYRARVLIPARTQRIEDGVILPSPRTTPATYRLAIDGEPTEHTGTLADLTAAIEGRLGLVDTSSRR